MNGAIGVRAELAARPLSTHAIMRTHHGQRLRGRDQRRLVNLPTVSSGKPKVYTARRLIMSPGRRSFGLFGTPAEIKALERGSRPQLLGRSESDCPAPSVRNHRPGGARRPDNGGGRQRMPLRQISKDVQDKT